MKDQRNNIETNKTCEGGIQHRVLCVGGWKVEEGRLSLLGGGVNVGLKKD